MAPFVREERRSDVSYAAALHWSETPPHAAVAHLDAGGAFIAGLPRDLRPFHKPPPTVLRL
jgi:hypothetical protein